MDTIGERKEAITAKIKEISQKKYYAYLLLGLIIAFGVYIRTRVLDNIQWKYPVEPDSFAFLRYAKYIVENGRLMDVDMLRYYPLGWSNLSEFKVLSYFIAYLYKFLHFLMPSLTIENVDVLYPVICFSIGIVFYFLFVKKIFDWKTALVSSAFLVVVPAYLSRTIAGAADKEAFAMMTIFAALYFFISAWKSPTTQKAILFSVLAALTTTLASAVWGGTIYLLLTITAFIFINLILGNINKKTLTTYAIWFLTSAVLLILIYPERYSLESLHDSLYLLLIVAVFLFSVVVYFIQKKAIIQKMYSPFKNRIPVELFIVITLIAITIIIALSKKIGQLNDPGNLLFQFKMFYIDLTDPYSGNRWASTISEGRIPYFVEWIQYFGYYLLIFGFGGAVLAFRTMLRPFRHKLIATTLFSLSILGIFFSRHSEKGLLDGKNTLSMLLFLGSIATIAFMFAYCYLKFYKNKRQSFSYLQKIDMGIAFLFIFSLYLLVTARSAGRLLFVFAPSVTAFAGYFIVAAIKKNRFTESSIYRTPIMLCLVIVAIFAFATIAGSSLDSAKTLGSMYHEQWIDAMDWVRENTPKDAVFAHWWDYGYFVQTGGERATLSDGGNARGAINYFIGRHLLTAQNETEALELLKANNATHLLIVSDDIPKYPSYSLIGSDKTLDRYSGIGQFTLDNEATKETKEKITAVYLGTSELDEDFIYQDKIYSKRNSAIVSIIIPMNKELQKLRSNKTTFKLTFNQPTIIIAYKRASRVQLDEVPLECIFAGDKEILFPKKGYPGCVMIIPLVERMEDGSLKEKKIGSALLLLPKVRRTVFTKLYLYDQPSRYFTKVYSDEDADSLNAFQGGILGPIKIWNITYPDNLTVPEIYYGEEVPDPELGNL